QAETYFGGERVVDPFTGDALNWKGGEKIADLFHRNADGSPIYLTDPEGHFLLHAKDDPMLHIVGDPVVHLRGEVQTYLGGEAVTDEQGNPVYTGSSPFLHVPDQGKIQDRLQQVYGLRNPDGSLVAINANTYVATTIARSGLSASTSFTVAEFFGTAYALGAEDLLSVT